MKATIFIVAFFFVTAASAQEYDDAIGIRVSYGGLINYKHRLNPDYFAEGIFAIRWGGIEFTALIERSQKAFGNENTYWFIGGGMHLGFHGRENTIGPSDSLNTKTYINLGTDLIGGIEYCFPKLPVSVSVDYKPSFHFTGERWFVGEGLGLSLRYVW